MKKAVKAGVFFALLLLLPLFFATCSDKADAPIVYGKPYVYADEELSLLFHDEKSLTLGVMSGELKGAYVIDGRKITISLPNDGEDSEFKDLVLNISDRNTLIPEGQEDVRFVLSENGPAEARFPLLLDAAYYLEGGSGGDSLLFKSDGTYVAVEDGEEYAGNYVVEGDKVTVYSPDGQDTMTVSVVGEKKIETEYGDTLAAK